MARAQDLAQMCDGVRRCKERAVQPSTPLAYEFRECFGDVRLRYSALDVFEHPTGVGFRDELEAQNTLKIH